MGSLRHDLMGHKGLAEFCVECRTRPDGTLAPAPGIPVSFPLPTTRPASKDPDPDDEARISLTARGWRASSDGVEQHAFSLAAEPVLRAALDLVTERGGQHGDTWRLPMALPFVRSVLALLGILDPPEDWLRLLECAAFVDMKDIRVGRGEFNKDDHEDGVNYRAAFTGWISEYHGEDTTDAILDQHRDSRTAG